MGNILCRLDDPPGLLCCAVLQPVQMQVQMLQVLQVLLQCQCSCALLSAAPEEEQTYWLRCHDSLEGIFQKIKTGCLYLAR